MATTVRRVGADRVEVLFGKHLEKDSTSAQKLIAFAQESGGRIIEEEGKVAGVETTERDYVRFLQSVNASKETITGFRRSLDDSKKAVRERMRQR